MGGRTTGHTRAAPEAAGRRRADAERNAAAIVTAATGRFADAPDANMRACARAAGVGRVTLYSPFPSREDLIRAVLEQAGGKSTEIIEDARSAQLPPGDAFAPLIRTTWPLIGRFGRLY